MSQALVISNDIVLNDIYAANLNAYVATNITVKESSEEALKLLELNPNFDLVICSARLNGDECAHRVIHGMSDLELELPIIVIGAEDNLPDGVVNIPAKYDLKSIIKTAAKLLEISARDMADLSVPEHFPIPLRLFVHIEESESDIFYRVKEADDVQYIKIQEKGNKLEIDFEKYEADNVRFLYVPAEERLKFINQASANIVGRLENDELETEERIELVVEGMEVVAGQISENAVVPEEIMKISNACVASINQVVREAPKLKGLLETLMANKTKYIFLHGIMASYISKEIIDNISWGGEGQADKISFVLFFHDLFLVPLYDAHKQLTHEEDLIYNDLLTESEKDLVLNHAKMAGELVQTFKQCPLGANTLITQHHGQKMGVGFASDFKDNVSPLAKVIIIAEEFVGELLKLEPDEWITKFDKKEVIAEMKKKYYRASYLKIIDALELANF